jgi:transposase
MLSQPQPVEYQSMVVGAAPLLKHLLDRLGVAEAIDRALRYQPDIPTPYGTLAQVIIVNRMTFQPQPLYALAEWAAQRGIDRLFDLQAAWLDDDRLGAMLDGLAKHQVTIWTTLLTHAVQRCQLDMEWLHADTTSVYVEGAYAQDDPPQVGDERIPRLLEGYNKDGQRNTLQFVLSLITAGRMPLWFRPWDGNQSDDAVYLADMTELRKTLLVPATAVLIGDRKLCTRDTVLAFSRQRQQFLAAHPWSVAAQATWRTTWCALQAGRLHWSEVDYVSHNNARKAPQERPRYRVCEVEHELLDPETGQVHRLRWVFSWSSEKARQDAQQRAKAIAAGSKALERIAGLLGQYDYTTRARIEARVEHALRKAKAQAYLAYTMREPTAEQGWGLQWQARQEALVDAACFDGVALLCTNVAPERLSAGDVMVKYKSQVNVEQTIDFIKSPVQIRPLWLHSPQRIAGLTLLIMIAVLVATLLEQEVRRWIAQTGERLKGVMPEQRDTAYPTATALLRVFADYAWVLVRHADGVEEVHHPRLRPVQQQIWDILELSLPSG